MDTLLIVLFYVVVLFALTLTPAFLLRRELFRRDEDYYTALYNAGRLSREDYEREVRKLFETKNTTTLS